MSGYASAILWSFGPTPSLCILRYWLISLSFIGTVSALLVKTLRIVILFSKRLQMKRIKLTALRLLPIVVFSFLLEVLLLTLWTLLDQQYVDLEQCRSQYYIPFTLVFIIEKGLYLLVLLISAVMMRNIKSEFNESAQIAFSVRRGRGGGKKKRKECRRLLPLLTLG